MSKHYQTNSNKYTPLLFLATLLVGITLQAQTKVSTYDAYLSIFTYEERKEMKINSVELTVMLEEDSAQLVDIRFKEEFEA